MNVKRKAYNELSLAMIEVMSRDVFCHGPLASARITEIQDNISPAKRGRDRSSGLLTLYMSSMTEMSWSLVLGGDNE